jgi:hypothetical protein
MFKITFLFLALLAFVAAETKTQYTTVSGGGCDPDGQIGYGMFVRLHLSLSEGASKIYAIRDQTVNIQVGGDNVVGALSSGLLAACVGEKRTIISSNEEGHGYANTMGTLMVPWIGGDAEEFWMSDSTRLLYFEVEVLQVAQEEDYKLFDHIRNDDIERALTALKSETIDITMQDEYGQTPLMASVGSQLLQVRMGSGWGGGGGAGQGKGEKGRSQKKTTSS